MQRPVLSSNWLKAFVDIVLLIWNTIVAAPYRTRSNLRTPIQVPVPNCFLSDSTQVYLYTAWYQQSTKLYQTITVLISVLTLLRKLGDSRGLNL